MKAGKQERIIAAITSSVVGCSALLLFVSGLGDKASYVEADNKALNNETETTQSAGNIEGGLSEGILGLTNLDAYMVGSPFIGAESAAVEKPETSEDEGEAQTEPEVEPETEPYQYADTFLVNIQGDGFLNVRSIPSADGELVGKIYRGGGGKVLERGAEWTKIQSGNVIGYASNEYLWFAEDAEAHMSEVCTRYAVSSANSLRVRKSASTDADIIAVINQGAEIQVLSVEGDWAKVSYIGKEAYIYAEYLDLEYVIEDGITIEEEQEAIRKEQERLAAEQKAKEEAEAARQQKIQQAINNSKLTETVQTSAYNVSEEEAYLLACVVCAEAGYESYEGKLAVANVVLNRLNGGYYGGSIYDVVYAKGQFAVVNNGALNRVINNGPNAESLQAAKDALAGKNNVPNYCNFCALGAADYDSYAEYSIICHQVFYRRK